MALATEQTESAKIRAQLNHPVIDVDGHHLEFQPAMSDYLRQAMGPTLYDQWRQADAAQAPTMDERRDWRQEQQAWWGAPAVNTLDRAAAALPELFHTRLDDLGVDFSILYTTAGLGPIRDAHDDVRQAFCYGINEFYAEQYGAYADRMTPAGLIPMHTPAEALAELDHCKQLGLKVVLLPSGVPRPIPALHRNHPQLFPQVNWLDTFGLDSAHDYDPVWQRLTDLGFAATFHTHQPHAGLMKSSKSLTSYVFNHLGAHFSIMYEVCKSLLMGGVTYRFPNLQFAFLECGVHWACGLLADFVEHWEKRNRNSIQHYDPSRIDRDLWLHLHREWGGKLVTPYQDQLSQLLQKDLDNPIRKMYEPDELDDFIHCGIQTKADIADRFQNFHFGCESDDRTVAFAFHPANAFGMRLKAMFSSDVGHWDVNDNLDILCNSYKLVQRGFLAEPDFRDFMADNPIGLHGKMNAKFWRGTVVEDYATKVLEPTV